MSEETNKEKKESPWDKEATTDNFELKVGEAFPALLFELGEPMELTSKYGTREAFNMRFLIEPEEGRFVAVKKLMNVPKIENGRLSVHKKSNLHKALKAIRPDKFQDDKLKGGVKMTDFLGSPCSVTLGERDGKDGATFIDVDTIGAMVKGAKAPTMAQAKAYTGEDVPF